MNTIEAVLTGDAIKSSKASYRDYSEFHEVLHKAANEFETINPNGLLAFEVFRGDAFQARLASPKLALLAVLFIRTIALRDLELDVRIAIGIGSLTQKIDKRLPLSQSDSEALRLSGRALDDMRKGQPSIAVSTGDKAATAYLTPPADLADCAIKTWRRGNTAEVVYWALTQTKQLEIADKVGISQSSVSAKLFHARWPYIERALSSWDTIVKTLWPTEMNEFD